MYKIVWYLEWGGGLRRGLENEERQLKGEQGTANHSQERKSALSSSSSDTKRRKHTSPSSSTASACPALSSPAQLSSSNTRILPAAHCRVRGGAHCVDTVTMSRSRRSCLLTHKPHFLLKPSLVPRTSLLRTVCCPEPCSSKQPETRVARGDGKKPNFSFQRALAPFPQTPGGLFTWCLCGQRFRLKLLQIPACPHQGAGSCYSSGFR